MMWCPVGPIFAEARSSCTSLSRTFESLILYSLVPSRLTTRSTVISSKSSGKTRVPFLSGLRRVMVTDARLARETLSEPLKMRSSPFLPRSDLMDCSPSTKRNASATFDFPEPLGPTIAVIGVVKTSSPLRANDLNPFMVSSLRYIQLLQNNDVRGRRRCCP